MPTFNRYPSLRDFPHTGGDFYIHLKHDKRDAIFDITMEFLNVAIPERFAQAIVYTDITGFTYKKGSNGLSRDLSDFEDGTENPKGEIEIRAAALNGDGTSFIVSQKWVHRIKSWNTLSLSTQEETIGRTKKESRELSPLPKGSHVERTEQEKTGFMFRQSQPFGDTKENGLRFIAYTKNLTIVDIQLKRMAGEDGVKDFIISRLSTNTAGAYWYVPNLEMLRGYTNKINLINISK